MIHRSTMFLWMRPKKKKMRMRQYVPQAQEQQPPSPSFPKPLLKIPMSLYTILEEEVEEDVAMVVPPPCSEPPCTQRRRRARGSTKPRPKTYEDHRRRSKNQALAQDDFDRIFHNILLLEYHRYE